MKVSIITPCFNDSKYLAGNIKSISDQSYHNIEHIIVDGASTDNTVKILRSNNNIKWVSEKDNGMYDAINKGISMATGDITAYLNADDRYFPQTVEHVVNCFSKNTSLDFIYGDCLFVDSEFNPLSGFKALNYYPWILKHGPIRWAQMSCFWKKSIHKKIGYFDESLKNVADYNFFKQMLFAGMRGAHLNIQLSKFMVRMDAISYAFEENYYKEISIVNSRFRQNKSLEIINAVMYYILNFTNYVGYSRRYIPYKFGNYKNYIKHSTNKLKERLS